MSDDKKPTAADLCELERLAPDGSIHTFETDGYVFCGPWPKTLGRARNLAQARSRVTIRRNERDDK